MPLSPFAFWGFLLLPKIRWEERTQNLGVGCFITWSPLRQRPWGTSLPRSVCLSLWLGLPSVLRPAIPTRWPGLCRMRRAPGVHPSSQPALLSSSQRTRSHTLKLIFRLTCVNTSTLDFKLHLFYSLLSPIFFPPILLFNLQLMKNSGKGMDSTIRPEPECWLHTSLTVHRLPKLITLPFSPL